VVLILVMLVFPQGIQGGLRRLMFAFFGPNQKPRTWRTAPANQVTPSADDLLVPGEEPPGPPEPPEKPASQHEKEGTS
jgi:hypothetical protein